MTLVMTRCFDEDSNILNTVNDGVPVCPEGGRGGTLKLETNVLVACFPKASKPRSKVNVF